MPTQNCRPGEELALDSLSVYLQNSALDIALLNHVEQFKNGFSNLTYRLDTDCGQFVLRRPPFGPRAAKAHDMGREFNVLDGLAPVFAKAPKAMLMCTDESIIGAPFYLMECVEGQIIRHQPGREQDSLTSKERSQASAALIETLADLHQLDLSNSPLSNFGKPEGYVNRQVEGWIGRFERAKTDNVSLPKGLVDYLRSEQPTDHPGALVHNDYKFDNVVFAANDYSTVAAVLDWEMCTVGHPLLDLGLTLAYWAHEEEVAEMPFLGMNATHLPGCWRRSELVSAYAKTSNLETGDLLYPFVFGNFKIAGIVQQIYARYAAGHTKDPRFAKLNHVVNYLMMRAERAVSVGSIE
ncbi:MAG: phosphotransferase family protein [Saprospiraceae bacterium]